jgi:hypothetical protein
MDGAEISSNEERVPRADAVELAWDWLSSLEHNKLSGLDPGIAEIEAINLANQYTRWHVQTCQRYGANVARWSFSNNGRTIE